MLLFQVGNFKIAQAILTDWIKIYSNTYPIMISSCLSPQENSKLIKLISNARIEFVFISNINFGTDISPYLQQLWYLKKNHYDIKYILKFHTKTDSVWRKEMIDIFMNDNVNLPH